MKRFKFIPFILAAAAISLITGCGASASKPSVYTEQLESGDTFAVISDGDKISDFFIIKKDYSRYDFSDWTNIVSFSDSGYHIVGLKSDGTVTAVGENGDCECSGTSEWKDIVYVETFNKNAYAGCTFGVKSDGTVAAVGDNAGDRCEVSEWTDIVAVAVGRNHSVGLKSDGTAVAAGMNDYSQSSVARWTDITAIAAGDNHTVGLKSDGTVVSVGEHEHRFGSCAVCGVKDWTDITAVSAGYRKTVGLRTDGTVVVATDNFNGRYDVSEWTDIVAVEAGEDYIAGLKSDGTVVIAGLIR